MKAAQKLAKKAKKDEKGSQAGIGNPPGGKFPQKPPRGQPNKCTVEGKDYYFHFKSHRWLPMDKQRDVSTPTPPAGNAAMTQRPTTQNGMNAERNLAFSIFTNQFQDAISALQATLADSS
jgi:hypothetical protein